MPMIDWTDAFDNSSYVPGAEALGEAWSLAARTFRATRPPEVLRYGPGERQVVDLYRPDGETRGLVVFVHGGYWRSRHARDFSHLAAGALARGWAVAQPAYTLAPQARIAEIGREIAAAVAAAGKIVAGPIRLTGHSAGGHLAARLACAETPLDDASVARLERVVPISGIFDLRPLQEAAMNDDLRLDAVEAEAESPALHAPGQVPVTLWVGAAERPEFLRQTRLLGEAWGRRGGSVAEIYEPGRNHFTVVEGLADPDSPLVEALLEGAA